MENEIYQALRQIYLYLADGDQQTLQPFDLDVPEYETLCILDGEEGWRMGDLCGRLLCDKSKMTRIIDHLEKRGWARRAPDASDRRAWRVLLTEKGKSYRQRVKAVHEQSLRQRLHVLDGDEQGQLQAILSKLRDSLATSYIPTNINPRTIKLL